jgi:hypothetical protein
MNPPFNLYVDVSALTRDSVEFCSFSRAGLPALKD